ncbi:MAG: right-handed parallel beta-helix repeat-containing protein, partial [Phycisphaerales bacterium]|nr:right-handed parallel beta-helix repeat-containing protein [Phycisphaerales bacterium]
RNCAFSGNAATYGGGMHNGNSNPTVINCAFSRNSAIYYNGGGMYNLNSSPTVAASIFNRNSAKFGGGMFSTSASSPTVIRCTFVMNTARNSGGGMYNKGGTPIVKECTYSENAATYGGGMFNDASSPTVTTCLFTGNMAREDLFQEKGGAMYNSGSNSIVTSCLFSGNSGYNGGAVYNSGGTSIVNNCTFSANTAFSGGAMYNASSSSTVTNSVLWGDSPQEIVNASSAPTIGFSNVLGGLPIGSVDEGGNLRLNPAFIRWPNPGPDGTWDGVDDDYGDLRLRGESPCIDKGDPKFVAQSGETDIDGHARVLCGKVDMGAYEFGIGDYDCDQVVDLADFSSWQVCMIGPHDVRELALAALTAPAVQSAIDNRQLAIGCEPFDFDGDGDVDLRDFAGFQRVFAGQ